VYTEGELKGVLEHVSDLGASNSHCFAGKVNMRIAVLGALFVAGVLLVTAGGLVFAPHFM
jgi:hypothetical protein